MDKFCKPGIEETVKRKQKRNCESEKVQSKVSTQQRQQRRDRACGYICQFFYEASIPHNTVTLGKDLVRSGITRFATAYLNPKSLQDNKKEMLKLFRSDELHEMGYLEKDKGKMAHKTVQSEAFWKSVGVAVNYFEPMANVLRRMDSDVPAMGFLYGCMLDAKKEIAASFDNDESRFKCVIDIIDKRWDSKLKSPLHLAGYFLNP